MASKESKYERVEKIDVDASGNMHLKDVREDRGKEDPGMNYQDKRPADIVPTNPVGFASNERDIRVSPSINSSHSSSRSSEFVEPQLSRPASGREFSTTTHEQRTTHTSSGLDANPIRNLENSASNEVRKLENRISGSSHSSTHSHHGAATGTASAISASNEARKLDNLSTTSSHSSINSHPERSSTTVTSQRTTIVKDQNVEGLGVQRTIPIQPHRQREEHEVIQHESHSRAPETTLITIPVTRFESAKMESTRSGVTYTEDRELSIPAPVVAPQIHGMTQNLHLTGGASAEIHATTDVNLATEAQLKDMGPEEYERYRQKVESLARQQEQELSQKAATYRNQIEKDADLIRQTLERQHIRDIEFRKDMVESAVDRQQREIQLEAEYAMRTLENEREAARAALDQAKMSSHIDVNIDSAIGTTHSQGKVTTTSEVKTEKVHGSPAVATRI